VPFFKDVKPWKDRRGIAVLFNFVSLFACMCLYFFAVVDCAAGCRLIFKDVTPWKDRRGIAVLFNYVRDVTPSNDCTLRSLNAMRFVCVEFTRCLHTARNSPSITMFLFISHLQNVRADNDVSDRLGLEWFFSQVYPRLVKLPGMRGVRINLIGDIAVQPDQVCRGVWSVCSIHFRCSSARTNFTFALFASPY
jgi:hypothetical protein